MELHQRRGSADRIFMERVVPSDTVPGLKYGLTVYFGGVIDCDCPSGIMRHRCKHADRLRASLSPFQIKLMMEHDTMRRRFGGGK